jgi:Ni/Fe-hydrogenase subunit HybB-like protein
MTTILSGPEPKPPPPKPGGSEMFALGFPVRLLDERETYGSITDKIGDIPLKHPRKWVWWICFLGTLVPMGMLGIAIGKLLYTGVGIWGINIPVAWGFAIVNFVWWVGIGHAGTFISVILLLLNQRWRASINRFTEAMTLFAITCAGLFPVFHLGRPWLAYWIFPYPDMMSLWPQFRSALVWDAWAVGTYFMVSLYFWYMGVIPDLAAVRDKCMPGFRRKVYAVLCLGWRGAASHWERYHEAYLLTAGLATPLVVSVHSVVSLDFAISIVPGWHETILPPYFVASAIYSGFAMILSLLLPIRKIYGLEPYITVRHLNAMGCVFLALGTMVAYSYAMEGFFAWYSGDVFEHYALANRTLGPDYAWAFWVLLAINIFIPQFAWSSRIRRRPALLWLLGISANAGMWLDHFLVIVPSLTRDFVPGRWRMYIPTGWDWAFLWGSVGLFLALMLLLIRYVPMVPISEVRKIVGEHEQTRV